MGIFFLVAVVFVIVIVVHVSQSNRLKDAWAEAAADLRLNFDRNAPKIYGNRPGVSVRIKTVWRNKTNWTEFSLRYDEPLPVNFGLEKQHSLSGITRLLSDGQDIEIGDADFDGRAIITGRDPEAVREFLSPDLRTQLREVFIAFDQFQINSLGFTCHMQKGVNNPAMVVRYMDLILHAAHALRHACEIKSEERVRVPPPLPQREEAPEVEEPPTEPETEEIVPTVIELDEVPVEVSPFEIREPEPPQMVELVEEKQPAPEPKLEPEPAPAPVVDDAFAATAVELFETHSSHYAALRQFDENLKNETVSGRLRVSGVSPFQHDRVFGRGPGAVVKGDLGKLENGKPVRLHVAYLDEEALPNLKKKIHSEISYSGTLVKCDPFSRQFFLIAETSKN